MRRRVGQVSERESLKMAYVRAFESTVIVVGDHGPLNARNIAARLRWEGPTRVKAWRSPPPPCPRVAATSARKQCPNAL